ncbi:hypothetical protein, partial [Candidatus Binatus sp.]|uniref:hypothetical protein n=1 Tax=Candidatus Binatus sp. TaxID=2811406 RepID=UPI003CC64A0B
SLLHELFGPFAEVFDRFTAVEIRWSWSGSSFVLPIHRISILRANVPFKAEPPTIVEKLI